MSRTDKDMFTPHDDSHVWSYSLCWTCYLTGRITERSEADKVRQQGRRFIQTLTVGLADINRKVFK